MEMDHTGLSLSVKELELISLSWWFRFARRSSSQHFFKDVGVAIWFRTVCHTSMKLLLPSFPSRAFN